MSRSHQTLIAALGIAAAFVVLHPYGFLEAEDAIVYFGGQNNSSAPHVLFYYAGYAALVPEITASLAALLPLVVQPFVYMAVAFVTGVYFLYQLNLTVIRVAVSRALTLCLVATLVLILVKLNSSLNFFTNLTYSIWFAWAGVFLRVLNQSNGRPVGWIAISFGVLALLSHPLCVVLAPILVVGAVVDRKGDRRLMAERLLYLFAIAVYFAMFVERGAGAPFDPQATLHQVWLYLTEKRSLYSLVGLGMLPLFAVIGLQALWSLAVRRGIEGVGPGTAVDRIVLSFVGGATMMAYLVSPRLLQLDQFQPRYLIPGLICLTLLAINGLLTHPAIRTRMDTLAGSPDGTIRSPRHQMTSLAATAVFIGLLLMANAVKGRQTPQLGAGAIADGVQFLLAADDYRRTCRDGAFIHHWDKWSLAVLCHRTALPSGEEPVPIKTGPIVVWRTEGTFSLEGRPVLTIPALFEPMRRFAFARPDAAPALAASLAAKP